MLERGRGNTPLYQQLEDILRTQIESGEYSMGDILPSESKLMEAYNVSRITVRQALADLTNLGYIEGRPGKGTVVIFSKINENQKRIVSFSEEMKQQGISMATSLCKAEEGIPTKDVAALLGLKKDERCFILTRVRNAGNMPLVYSITYIPLSWQLPLDESLYKESLYEFLAKKQGIIVSGGHETFEAMLASNELANFLGIKEGSQIMQRTRISYDCNKNLIEYTYAYYRGDRYKYSVEL